MAIDPSHCGWSGRHRQNGRSFSLSFGRFPGDFEDRLLKATNTRILSFYPCFKLANFVLRILGTSRRGEGCQSDNGPCETIGQLC